MEPGIAKAGLTWPKLPQPHAPAFAKVSFSRRDCEFCGAQYSCRSKNFFNDTRYYFGRNLLASCWITSSPPFVFLLFLLVSSCVPYVLPFSLLFFHFLTFFRYVSLRTNIVSRHPHIPTSKSSKLRFLSDIFYVIRNKTATPIGMRAKGEY